MLKIKVNIVLTLILLLFCWKNNVHAQDPTISKKGRFSVDYYKGCPGMVVKVESENLQTDNTLTYFTYDQDGNKVFLINKLSEPFLEPGEYFIYQNITGLDNPFDRQDSVKIEITEPRTPQVEINNCGNGTVTVKANQGQYDYFVVDGNAALRLDASNGFERRISYSVGQQNISVQGMYSGTGIFNNCGDTTLSVDVRESLLPPATISEVRANVQDQTITLRYNLLPNVQYNLEARENGSGEFTSLGPLYGSEFVLNDQDIVSWYYCFRIRTVNPCDPEYVDQFFYSNTVCTSALSGRPTEEGNVINFKTRSTPGLDLNLLRDGEPVKNFDGKSPFLDLGVNCNTSYEYAIQINYGNSASVTEGLSLTSGSNAILQEPENVASYWEGHTPYFKLLLPNPPAEAQYDAYFTEQEGGDLATSSDSTVLQLINTANNSCYLLEYTDECGNTSPRSREICALYLTNTSTEPDVLQLEWNDYSGYNEGVKGYVLEEYNPEGKLIQTVDIGFTTSIDLGEQPLDKSGYYYIVTAIPLDESLEETRSNQYELEIVIKPYFPNTFNPTGKEPNNLFRALGKFVEGGTLEIFNRWGAPVFKTNDLSLGWDGTIDGKPAPYGTYYYKALVSTVDGIQHSQQGTVLLMRK